MWAHALDVFFISMLTSLLQIFSKKRKNCVAYSKQCYESAQNRKSFCDITASWANAKANVLG